MTVMKRRLAVVEDIQPAQEQQGVLKLAFGSTDRKHVDSHFGSCTKFAVYSVSASESNFVEVIEFEEAKMDGNEDKLIPRIEAISSCDAVYVKAVGASAIGQLKKHGIQPMKVSPNSPIGMLINEVQQEMNGNPPAWIAQALAPGKDPDRFDDMDAEGWDE